MSEILRILKDAFLQSDSVGKGIVVILAACSAVSWSIILTKVATVASFRRKCKTFIYDFDSCESVMDLGHQVKGDGPLESVCLAGFKSLMEVLDIPQEQRERFLRRAKLPRDLKDVEIEKIRTSMQRNLNIQRMELMELMVMIGTIIPLSPYLGLFGTVWGVMMTFVNLAAQQGKKADLGQLAPGVSAALLTTVVGLLVAIPSVVGNNFIMNSIDKTCAEMDAFVEDFIAKLRLETCDERAFGQDADGRADSYGER